MSDEAILCVWCRDVVVLGATEADEHGRFYWGRVAALRPLRTADDLAPVNPVDAPRGTLGYGWLAICRVCQSKVEPWASRKRGTP